jgi:hypothetical protein
MSASTASENVRPIVSHVGPDGTLAEVLFDRVNAATSLAVRSPDGTMCVQAALELPSGERLVPYSANNNLIASGCVLLPGEVGDFRDKGDLLEGIRRYIHRYVDLSPLFEEIAAHYVLLSWTYDAFNELPYLRFRGDFGTGKTRALLAIGSICYKPFFASGASTVSPIFHVIDAFGGTLVLDEADLRFSDATAELTKILNNGNVDGLPILRTMTNRHKELNPQAFRVFGPKLVAMREAFQDRALESRFLTEECGHRTLRPDIPIHQPPEMRREALALRNRLLAWRFSSFGTVGPITGRKIAGVSPRLNQTALALLSIVDDANLRERMASELRGEEARVMNERALTIEAQVLTALVEASVETPGRNVALAEIARRYVTKNSGVLQNSISSKTIGHVVRAKLRLPTTKSNGVYVVPSTAAPRITALAERFGLAVDQKEEG